MKKILKNRIIMFFVLLFGVYFITAAQIIFAAEINGQVWSNDEISGNNALLNTPLIIKKLNIQGRVVLPDNTPVPDAEVAVYDGYEAYYVYTDLEGYFKLNLTMGSYEIEVTPPYYDTNFAQYGSVYKVITIDITGVDLGNIVLPKWTKKISGTVTHNGAGVSNKEVWVDNWNSDLFRYAITDDKGQFEIWVTGGLWEVSMYQEDSVNWVIPEIKEVEFAQDESSETHTLVMELKDPDGYITGRILDPLGSPPEFGGVIIELFNMENNAYYFIFPEDTGNFKFPVLAGRYELSVWVDPWVYTEYAASALPTVDMISGTMDIGDIKMIYRNATISGTVKDETGAPIDWVIVDVFDDNGRWFFTETSETGAYTIKVPAGEWMVEPWYEETDYIFTQSSKAAKMAENGKAVLDFNMEKTAETISGIVKDEDGNILTDIEALAYFCYENTPPLTYTYVEDGKFSLSIPSGTVFIGLELAPKMEYTFDDEVQFGSTEPVIITLKKNDALIKGTLRDIDGNPVTDVKGRISAALISDDINSWQENEIRSEAGTFELKVSEGTWNLTYDLDTGDYVARSTESLEVDVKAGGTTTHDITLIPLDEIVAGYVNDPDGNRMPNTQVWIRCLKDGKLIYQNNMFTDSEGNFSFKVPGKDIAAGADIFVGTAVNTSDTEYSQLSGKRGSRSRRSSSSQSAQSSDAKKRSDSSQVVLTLRDADIYLKGKVTDRNGNVENAFVSAYSNDSQTIQGNTDSSGNYELYIARADSMAGNQWTISAAYRETGDTAYYRSQKAVVCTCGSKEVFEVPDLVLEDSGKFPPPVTRTFQPDNPWSLTLSDGFHIEIPSHTIPTRNESLMATVAPVVDGLPHKLENRVVSHGYDIKLIEKKTGKEIHNEFKNNVILSFGYTDEQLAELGIEESDIYPAYFSEVSYMWHPLQNFVLDTQNNKVTFRTRHLSLWALVTEESVNEDTTGDMNGDSIVNLADLILVLKAFVQASTSPELCQQADISGDDKIGLEEAIYILRKLSE